MLSFTSRPAKSKAGTIEYLDVSFSVVFKVLIWTFIIKFLALLTHAWLRPPENCMHAWVYSIMYCIILCIQ